MGFDEKKLLKSENARRTNDFIISKRDKLVLRHHSVWPGIIFSAETTLLQKHKEMLSGGNHLGFIYETKLPPGYQLDSPESSPIPNSKFSSSRPTADSFYWQTTQKHIQDAIAHGIFDPGALTAKVIGAVGSYRGLVLERAYDNGIISNKYWHKEVLLRLTQTRIRSLEELERLTNSYDHGTSADGNAHRIIDTLENYIQKLTDLREQVKSDLTTLNDFDLEANQKIQNQITEDILRAEEYRDELINSWSRNELNQHTIQNVVLSASGPLSIAHFIKLRMITALREAQEHNQNMTYSRDAISFSRGQFNSFCEDALRVINEHQPDQHNPTLKEHQGYYGADEESITINFQHLGENRQKIRQTLMAITQIEGRDVIAKDTSKVVEQNSVNNDNAGCYYIISTAANGEQFKHRLKTTHLTGWDVQDDKSYLPKRIFFWFWNFIFVGMLGGLIIDLLPNLWVGLRGREPKSFVSRLRLGFTPVCVEDTQFIKLADKINIPSVSLGAIVGQAIGNFFRNTIWEIRSGLKSTYKLAKLQIFDNLVSDYKIGHNPLPYEGDLYQIIQKELKVHHDKELKFLRKLETLHRKAGVREYSKIKPDEIISRHAGAPYELSPGEWSDVVNSSLNGAKHIIESVTHEVHAKHPFAGLLFNFFYIAGGLAILAPQYVSFLGKYFLQISKAIADASSTQPFGGAISAAFYEAYVSATLTELLVSGRDSGLISALTSLEDQPSSFMIYGTLAVGLGWFLANVMDIPGISDSIRDEAGTIPAIAYGAAGAKFGIVLLELFTIEPSAPESEQEIKREKLRHFFKTEYPHFEEEKTESLIEDLLDRTLAFNSKPETKPAMRRLEFLMTLQQHQHILPNLPNLRKRQLIEVMRRQEGTDPHLVDAVQQMLFPESKKSILGVTMGIIFAYVFGLARCLAAVVTWNTEPFRYVFIERIPKDLARLYHAINNKILNTFFNYLRAMVRGICDVVANEIIARTEGFFRSKHHKISRGTYSITSAFDRGFTSAKEYLGRISGIDPLRKAVTKPHGYSVFRRIYHKFRFGYFARRDSQPQIATPIQAIKTIDKHRPPKKAGKFAPLFLNKSERAAELNELHKTQLLDFITSDSNSTPHVIRALLSEEKSRIEFFNKLFQLDDNNDLYRALKEADLNHEIIHEIIETNFKFKYKNLRLKPEQILELICIDRSGTCAIALFKAQFSPSIIQQIQQAPVWLSKIIENFYHNAEVMKHVIINTHHPKSRDLFNKSFETVFHSLKESNPLATLELLYSLMDNAGTQQASLEYLNENFEAFDCFIQSLENTPELIQSKDRLLAKMSLITGLKFQQNWSNITENYKNFTTQPKESENKSTQTDKTLFKGFSDARGFIFFNLSPSTRVVENVHSTPRKATAFSQHTIRTVH